MLRYLKWLVFGKNKMIKDLALLQNEVKPFDEILISFTINELALLSSNHGHKKIKRRFSKLTKGFFCTIYGELLVSFAYKDYSKTKRLVLIKVSDCEFVYLIDGGKTQVYIDEKEIGILTSDGRLINSNNQLIGTIDLMSGSSVLGIKILDKEMGYMKLNEAETKVPERTFH